MSTISNKKNGLLSFLDAVFVVNGEMIPDNGEDSFAYSVNDSLGMIGVFDGCGGIGSRKYPEYNNKSGAYIASRMTGDMTMNWFKQICAGGISPFGNNTPQLCNNLKINLAERLKGMETMVNNSVMKGSLTKSFPTTASVILFSNAKKTLYSTFIWAGDSRGFILTPEGLCQITKDDIEGESDALTNLSADGKLTNLVSAMGDFQLHSRQIVSDEPQILITATDGCFAYFPTPMEFEYMLVESLQQSDSIAQWKQNLDQYVKKFTSDDYTMGIAVCGYTSFENLKQAFASRRMFLYQNYISRLAVGEDDMKVALWNEYKKTYYRGV